MTDPSGCGLLGGPKRFLVERPKLHFVAQEGQAHPFGCDPVRESADAEKVTGLIGYRKASKLPPQRCPTRPPLRQGQTQLRTDHGRVPAIWNHREASALLLLSAANSSFDPVPGRHKTLARRTNMQGETVGILRYRARLTLSEAIVSFSFWKLGPAMNAKLHSRY